MDKASVVCIAGADSLIGAALVRELLRQGFHRVIGAPASGTNAGDAETDQFFAEVRPDYVFLAAGRSGGIMANLRMPAELMLDNLIAECRVINAAHRHGVTKLLYFASSCCYPKLANQPIREEALLTGLLEPTNEPYAIAKIAGIKLCQSYRSQFGCDFVAAVPADIFGPGDSWDPTDSHVVPGLLRRMHQAKVESSPAVEIWGTGNPRREFLFADDLANAAVFAMEHYSGPEPINLGGGTGLSIRELAETIRDVVGYGGGLAYDPTKPDGVTVKMLDSSKLFALGWKPRVSLAEGLAATYRSFLSDIGVSAKEGR